MFIFYLNKLSEYSLNRYVKPATVHTDIYNSIQFLSEQIKLKMHLVHWKVRFSLKTLENIILYYIIKYLLKRRRVILQYHSKCLHREKK